MTTDDHIHIQHEPDEERYGLYVNGELASFAEYRDRGDTLVFHHTVTLPRFRGRNLASRLVGWALDDVADRDKRIVPVCWFVAEFIEENPEYADLVPPERRRPA